MLVKCSKSVPQVFKRHSLPGHMFRECGHRLYMNCCLVSQSLRWRHNEHDGVSNHQPHHCFLNRLFRRRSKKTSKLRATGLFAGNSPVTGEFPHKWPVTRKMFPFFDVIMVYRVRKKICYFQGFPLRMHGIVIILNCIKFFMVRN